MVHVFKKVDGGASYELLLPHQTIWGAQWNPLLGTTSADVDAFNKTGNVLCSGCYFKRVFDVGRPGVIPAETAHELRMVIQTSEFPESVSGSCLLELHAVEAFLLFPENDTLSQQPNYCPHVLFCHPLETVVIEDQRTLDGHTETYARPKDSLDPLTPPGANVKTAFGRSKAHSYSITTGSRRWDVKDRRWKNPREKMDLITCPPHSQSWAKFAGRAAPLVQVQGGRAVCSDCSFCGREINL